MGEPCELCKANEKPNCGNDWCHTNQEGDNEKVWVVDCNFCGSKELTTWKAAIEDGCPLCGSSKISIYHKESIKEDQ